MPAVKEVFIWLLLLLGLIIVLMIVFVSLRRLLRDDGAPQAGVTAFSLGDLRQLLKEGKLTQEEHDRLKQQIVDAAKEAPEKPVPKKPADPLEPPL